MLVIEENFLGNEKLPCDGLDQRQGHKDDEESAIMLFDVSPNYVCPKYCTFGVRYLFAIISLANFSRQFYCQIID